MTQQSVADVVKKKAPSHSFSDKKQITIRKVNYKYSHLLSIYRMSQTLREKGEKGKTSQRTAASYLRL